MQRVVTWNLDWWQKNGPQPERVPVITSQDDVVWLLQELKHSTMQAIRQQWPGPTSSTTEVWPTATARWMAAAILLPEGSTIHDAGCVADLPRPQRSLWIDATVPALGRATLVTWHTENAATDRPRKMACYRAMHDWLANRSGPIVLGVDTNSWRDPADLLPADRDGRSFEEHEFLGPDNRHGLQDAHRQVLERDGGLDVFRENQPEGPLAVSYVLSSGVGHRMDRIFISDHFTAHTTRYDFEGALEAGSDHALHEAALTRESQM